MAVDEGCRDSLVRRTLRSLLAVSVLLLAACEPAPPTPVPLASPAVAPIAPASVLLPSPTSPALTPTPAPSPVFGAPRTLLALPADAAGPIRVSPDGRWVAFALRPSSADRQPTRAPTPDRTPASAQTATPADSPAATPRTLVQYVVVGARDGTARSLLEGEAAPNDVDWFPDGQRLLVATRGDGGSSGLAVLQLSGGKPYWVVGAPVGSRGIVEAALSPDGVLVALLIAYQRPNAVAPELALDVVPLAGGGPKRLADGLTSVSDLAWTPDGRALTYFAGDAGSADGWGSTYQVALTGGSPTLAMARAKLVGWSPDGERGLWLAREPGAASAPPALVVTRRRDGQDRELGRRPVESFGGAAWLESGDWLTFASRGQLWLAPAEDPGQATPLTPEEREVVEPVWLDRVGLAYRAGSGAGHILRLLPLR